jgi:hypothetical protein
MKSENNTPLLKKIIVEWILNSSAHGLPKIFRNSNTLLKIIWLCCFLVSGSTCIFSIIRTLNDYLTYPTFISTQIIQEVPTYFPAVTLCNLKTVNKTKSKNYLISSVEQLERSWFQTPLEYITSQQYMTQSIINNDKNLTDETRKELGFEMKDMLVSCMYKYQNCYPYDFTYFYDPLYGNCYTFNKGVYDNETSYDIRKVSIAGQSYGLSLELFLGDTQVDTQEEYNDGMIISIHNQTTIPFTKGDEIKIPANAETDLVISRNFVSKLEYPYGNCLKDTTSSSEFTSYYFDYLVRTLNKSYSYKYCFGLCVQKQIMGSCNCTNTFMPIFNDSSHFCDNSVKVICMSQVVEHFENNQALKECLSFCPNECDTIEYGVTTYKALYPTNFYASILNEKLKVNGINVSNENSDQAFLKVNIYYKSLEYLVTTQKPQTSLENFFGNIGGTMSLYVGISILSFVEVFELGINLILGLMKGKKHVQVNVQEAVTIKKNIF